jgi:endo-1,4-beta-D-glucanase Y
MKKFNVLLKTFSWAIVSLLCFSSFAQTQTFPANRTYPSGLLPSNRNGQDAVNNYNIWKTNFLEPCSNGRYRVAFDSASETVSEGIGYGMLLTAYAGDRSIFDGLWNYYKDNRNANGVMNWKISGCSGTIGQNGATDAEVDAAMALIVADYQWGSTGTINYSADAKTLITAMKNTEVEASTFVLKPGDAFGGSGLTNPSYFAPGYFRKFATFMNDPFWNNVATKCYDIISKNLSINNAVGGIVSDWCAASGAYSNQAGGYVNGGKTYLYDAARTPWRIAVDYAWFGNADAKTYVKKSSEFARVTIGGSQNIVDGYNQNGTRVGQYHNATFVGAFASAAIGGDNQAHLNNSYTDLNSTNEPNSYFNQTLKTLYLFLLSGNFYLPGNGTVTPIAVTSVSVSPTAVSLNTGQTRQLIPTILPTNATNKNVTYTSSNAGIASVNAAGLVSAVAAGSATITVRTVDGNKTATTNITVTTVTNPVAVASVSIAPTAVSLSTGQTRQLTPTVLPSNATNKSVSYSSSNASIASVNASGLVRAVAVGNATITVKTVDGNKTATATITVTTGTPTSCSFGAPTTAALPALNTNYTKMYVFGAGGPNLSNFREFQINWDLGNNGLYVFAYSTKNGIPDWYNDLKSKITQNFNATKPSVTISNSGIGGLDGAYWVTKKGSDFVMVSKTQGFTLYFSNAATAPACSNAREGVSDDLATNNSFRFYPNPTNGFITIEQVAANAFIRVVDLQGKVLLEKETTKADTIVLDLSKFKAGIYSLQVSTTAETKSQKLILQQ